MINTKGHNLYTLASLLLFLQVFLFYDGGSLISKMQARWSGIETQSCHMTRPATNVFMEQLKEIKEFFVVCILMVASLDKHNARKMKIPGFGLQSAVYKMNRKGNTST